MRCYCVPRDAHGRIEPDRRTPYELPHGHACGGRFIPFGAPVSYKPSAKRETSYTLKLDGRMRKGVLVGYVPPPLRRGGGGSGDYMVIDWQMYAFVPRHCGVHVRRVREAHCDEQWSFPAHDMRLSSEGTSSQANSSHPDHDALRGILADVDTTASGALDGRGGSRLLHRHHRRRRAELKGPPPTMESRNTQTTNGSSKPTFRSGSTTSLGEHCSHRRNAALHHRLRSTYST